MKEILSIQLLESAKEIEIFTFRNFGGKNRKRKKIFLNRLGTGNAI